MMLTLQNISYTHPNKDVLFEHLHLTVAPSQKIALIGNNGAGKSTLLQIIAGELPPSSGRLDASAPPYKVPQIFGQYNHLTVARCLHIEPRLRALHEILNGNVTEENYALLDDDWTLEERCHRTLEDWQLTGLDLSQRLETLSGGQKTKVFLAGIAIHQPGLVLLDEPSNHLDRTARQRLYRFVQDTQSSLVVVSHDRKLLNLLDTVYELNKGGLTAYGGNYDFYRAQKQQEQQALNQDIQAREKDLRKAKEKERETLERQQRSDARGKGKQEKAGVARIMMNTLRNQAENSTSKIKSAHTEKISGLEQQLHERRSALPDLDKIRFGLNSSALHKGKVLFTATGLNYRYGTRQLWKENLDLHLTSGERIQLKGNNGSGKTTLIRLILNELQPQWGTVYRASARSVYLDQDYSLIDPALEIHQQAQRFNTAGFQEHEVNIRLTRFLFTREHWDKPCGVLSGGERMRLALCCLTMSSHPPDLIILDEPTNNLDIQNMELLTAALNEYEGTLVAVSHDETFLEQINIERTLEL